MLKRIRVTQLRLGMHLQRLDEGWLDHGRWRSEILLTDPAELEQLRASDAESCWIDLSKGLDVDSEPAPAPGPLPGPASMPLRPFLAPPPPRGGSPLADEIERACGLVLQARHSMLELLGQARAGRPPDASACRPLVDAIADSVHRHPDAFIGLARLKRHDDYFCMHPVAVCALMVSLARQMGQDEELVRAAGLAGLLHDVGKAAMPEALLNKPGKLTEEEFGIMRTHPLRGYELLRAGGSASDIALDVCLHHHEKVDGSGYPHGLGGDQISPMAKMAAVCDVYDAITSNRPYKNGRDPAASIRKMAEWRRGQFDDAVFQAFVKGVGIYPVGSLVRMHSARLAVVVEQNPESLVAPVVKVFFSTRSQQPVTPELLDLGSAGCSDRIVGREPNGMWHFTHLDTLWAGAAALQRLGRA